MVKKYNILDKKFKILIIAFIIPFFGFLFKFYMSNGYALAKDNKKEFKIYKRSTNKKMEQIKDLTYENSKNISVLTATMKNSLLLSAQGQKYINGKIDLLYENIRDIKSINDSMLKMITYKSDRNYLEK